MTTPPHPLIKHRGKFFIDEFKEANELPLGPEDLRVLFLAMNSTTSREKLEAPTVFPEGVEASLIKNVTGNPDLIEGPGD